MAKDGTRRGGARIGAGRKKKSLEDKILEGQVLEPEPLNLEPSDFEIPAPKEYILAEQKTGRFYAGEVYDATYAWLKKCGCAESVTPQLIEDYAQMIARHIQAEEILTRAGLLAKHPTTGEPTTSPFVKISLDYLKAAQQIWYQIYQIVRESSTSAGAGSSTDTMELILRQVRQVR